MAKPRYRYGGTDAHSFLVFFLSFFIYRTTLSPASNRSLPLSAPIARWKNFSADLRPPCSLFCLFVVLSFTPLFADPSRRPPRRRTSMDSPPPWVPGSALAAGSSMQQRRPPTIRREVKWRSTRKRDKKEKD